MGVIDTFTATTGAATTGSATLTVPVPRAVAAGMAIVLVTERADASNTPGVAGITDTRGNSWTLNDAYSQRGNVTEVAIHHGRISTALQAGDNIVVTWNAANASRKNVICHVVDNLQAPSFDVGSGATVPAAGANSGPNGSSTSPSGSTTAATAGTADLVFAAVGFNASVTFTHDAAYTAGTSVATTSGSSDRALATQYRQLSAAGTQTAGGSLSASSGWAMAVAAYKTTTSAAPTVNAGPDQTGIEPGSTVTLTATGTPASGHTIESYVWTAPSGRVLTGDGGIDQTVTYDAPGVIGGVTDTFSVVAIDDTGAASAPDSVNVTVNNPPERIVIGGAWVPAKWGIFTGTPGGGGGGGTTGALTLTVTPDPTFTPPRIRIDISDTRDQPATSLTIYRRNPDGKVNPVRTSDGGPLPVSGGVATIWDYEPLPDEPITYYTDDAGAAPVNTELVTARPWLIPPGIPARAFSPYQMGRGTDQQATWDVPQGSFTVLGRSTPVITSGGARLAPASTLVIVTSDASQLAALKLLLSDAGVLYLSVPPQLGWGIDSCYISVGKVQVDRPSPILTDPYRYVTLSYQVVARPAGGTRAAFTWDDVAANYSSWQVEGGANATWDALASSGP